jgi:hypothetical protein
MENFDLINLEYRWFLITLKNNIQNYLNSKLNWPNDDLINENSNKIKFSKPSYERNLKIIKKSHKQQLLNYLNLKY